MKKELHILDTDTLSLVQRSHPVVVLNLKALPQRQRGITVISLEEQMRGRLAQVSKAKYATDEHQHAYDLLLQTHRSLCRTQILSFDDKSQKKFDNLKQLKIRIGTLDMRIAAIALANHAILVTSNYNDFSKVPGLQIVDWSRSQT